MKKLISFISVMFCCMALVACGGTTMDNGNDTNGMPGENTQTESNNAQNSIDSATEGAGNAVKDAADGVGNAAKDVVDGATNAIDSATDGVTGAVDNATGNR